MGFFGQARVQGLGLLSLTHKLDLRPPQSDPQTRPRPLDDTNHEPCEQIAELQKQIEAEKQRYLKLEKELTLEMSRFVGWG